MAEVPPFLWADAGDFDSPKEYVVPGAGEVQPYTATATYVNASGQAILPALRLKSDSGNLLSLTFPVGQTIADGSSSEVTFVPPFGSAQGSGATPTTITYPTCRVRRSLATTDQNIATGTETAMLFNSVAVNTDATIFTPTVSNSVLGLNQIKVLTAGLYSALGRAFWNNQPDQATLSIQGPDPDGFAEYPAAGIFINQHLTNFVFGIYRLQANQIIYLSVQQRSGVTKTLDRLGGNFLELCRLGDVDTTGTNWP